MQTAAARAVMMAIVVAFLVGLTGLAPAVQAGERPTGVWRMADGKVTVKVSPCGTGYCGTVIGLRKPRDGKGRPRLDKENPNPALRSRPVIGLTILSNMKANGEGRWSGTIYNPDDGHTYSSSMQLLGPTMMKVNGCVAGVLCKSLKFVRVQ